MATSEEVLRVSETALRSLMEASRCAQKLPTSGDYEDSVLLSKGWKAGIEAATRAAKVTVARVATMTGSPDTENYESVSTAIHKLLDQASGVLALAATTETPKKRKRKEKPVVLPVRRKIIVLEERQAVEVPRLRAMPRLREDDVFVDSEDAARQAAAWLFSAKQVAVVFGDVGKRKPCVVAARGEKAFLFNVDVPSVRERLVTTLKSLFEDPAVVKLVTDRLPYFITSSANVVDLRDQQLHDDDDEEIPTTNDDEGYTEMERQRFCRQAWALLEFYDSGKTLVKVDAARTALHGALKGMRVCRSVLGSRIDAVVKTADALWRSSTVSLDIHPTVQLAWDARSLLEDEKDVPADALAVLKAVLDDADDDDEAHQQQSDVRTVAAAAPTIVLRQDDGRRGLAPRLPTTTPTTTVEDGSSSPPPREKAARKTVLGAVTVAQEDASPPADIPAVDYSAASAMRAGWPGAINLT